MKFSVHNALIAAIYSLLFLFLFQLTACGGDGGDSLPEDETAASSSDAATPPSLPNVSCGTGLDTDMSTNVEVAEAEEAEEERVDDIDFDESSDEPDDNFPVQVTPTYTPRLLANGLLSVVVADEDLDRISAEIEVAGGQVLEVREAKRAGFKTVIVAGCGANVTIDNSTSTTTTTTVTSE